MRPHTAAIIRRAINAANPNAKEGLGVMKLRIRERRGETAADDRGSSPSADATDRDGSLSGADSGSIVDIDLSRILAAVSLRRPRAVARNRFSNCARWAG